MVFCLLFFFFSHFFSIFFIFFLLKKKQPSKKHKHTVATTNASIVSSTQVRCNVPSKESIFTTSSASSFSNLIDVSITLLNNPCPILHSIQLKYRIEPYLFSIYPKYGSEKGNTTLTLHGHQFDKTIQCIFSTLETQNVLNTVSTDSNVVVVPSIYKSNTVIQCVTPARQTKTNKLGFISISVSSKDSILVSGNSIEYQYVSHPYVSSYLPRTGPSYSTNTIVTLLGTNLNHMKECQFGNKYSNVTVLSNNQIQCVPPSQLKGNYSLHIYSKGRQDRVYVGTYTYTENIEGKIFFVAR